MSKLTRKLFTCANIDAGAEAIREMLPGELSENGYRAVSAHVLAAVIKEASDKSSKKGKRCRA